MFARLSIYALILVFLFGCGGKANTAADQENSPPANEGRDIPVAWKIGEAAPIEDVSFTTSDGIEIAASYRPAAGEPSGKVPGLICIPMLSRTRSDYDDFTKLLSEIGIASIAIDVRGHGDSTMDGRIRFSRFTEKDWNECTKDVNAAMGWLRKRGDVDERYIGVIGASIGL